MTNFDNKKKDAKKESLTRCESRSAGKPLEEQVHRLEGVQEKLPGQLTSIDFLSLKHDLIVYLSWVEEGNYGNEDDFFNKFLQHKLKIKPESTFWISAKNFKRTDSESWESALFIVLKKVVFTEHGLKFKNFDPKVVTSAEIKYLEIKGDFSPD